MPPYQLERGPPFASLLLALRTAVPTVIRSAIGRVPRAPLTRSLPRGTSIARAIRGPVNRTSLILSTEASRPVTLAPSPRMLPGRTPVIGPLRGPVIATSPGLPSPLLGILSSPGAEGALLPLARLGRRRTLTVAGCRILGAARRTAFIAVTPHLSAHLPLHAHLALAMLPRLSPLTPISGTGMGAGRWGLAVTPAPLGWGPLGSLGALISLPPVFSPWLTPGAGRLAPALALHLLMGITLLALTPLLGRTGLIRASWRRSRRWPRNPALSRISLATILHPIARLALGCRHRGQCERQPAKGANREQSTLPLAHYPSPLIANGMPNPRLSGVTTLPRGPNPNRLP